MKKTLFIAATIIVMAAVASAETPRFRGPEGDGKFTATGLLREWPTDGPPKVWTAEGFGEGYSSVAVSDGKIYVTGMTPDRTGHLYILDLEGTVQGKISYGPETLDDWAPGPRATPTIDGNRAYLLSGPGVVYALDLEAGTVLWQVDILARFGAENITWQLAESLLLDGDNLICTPGGSDGAVVALNKMTGETVWAMTELNEPASYCSPAIITHNGRRILVTMPTNYVVGLDPDTGALLWRQRHTTRHDIHAVTPVYGNGMLYYSSGYGSGGGALALSDDGESVTLKWQDKTLDCQHHGVVLVDGYLYGTAHSDRTGLVCLELATGRVMWTAAEITQGNVVYADGMLYVYEGPRVGQVSLIKPSPEGLDVRGQFTVTAGTEQHWPHPTIAHGLLLIRRGDAVAAYNIKAE